MKIRSILLLFISIGTYAQTGIGTTTPNASAKLEVYATNKGFLPPRIALTGTSDVVTISSPANGLIIYNTATAGTTPNNVLPGYYYWDGNKWNGLIDQGALNAFSGYNPNYAQSNSSSVTKSAAGDVIVSQSITSAGRPIQIIATGDANPQVNGAWVQMQLYRDGTAIGKKIQAESSSSNENVPYCLNFIDNPTAGTYTYSVKITAIGGGAFQFGEADGNQLTLVELGAWSAGTVPVSKGGTGVTTSTGTGSVVLSSSPSLDLLTVTSGSSQWPSSITVNPTTHATSKRAGIWLGDWGVLQDFYGDGTRNFSITQNTSGSYPTRFYIHPNGNVGIGQSSPTQLLDVAGNVNVSGKINLTDPSGNVSTKISGFVNPGNYISFENIKATVTTSGNRSIAVGAVSSTFVCDISAYYSNGSAGSGVATDITVTTSPSLSGTWFGWGFSPGNSTIYLINDKTSNKFYQITIMFGINYSNNFIIIERLY